MHRILLAEDDDAIVRLLTDFLREEGFAVTAAAGEHSAREALERERFDLALVDLQLADGSGFGVCAAARARQLPVIFLTASSDESTVVSGFDMGADDYVAKPFGMMEMVSRIRAVLRRTAPAAAPGLLQMGNLRMDSASHTVYAGDTRVELTLKEFDLLCLLLQNKGTVFTRDKLLNKIWGYDFDGESRTVDVHVRTLRQKLGEAGKYIETVRGIGYKIGD